ncbi:MAG: GntR family transcriptional regulator [Pirellulales bacterium]|nr:GntR family transcriptional regulator [Pirellulales bacterium]
MSVSTEIFRNTRQPKHRQVREFVLEQMAVGRLKVGDSLPAEGVLAESLGVGRNTVRHALGDLARQGFIERVQGRGVFVTREVQLQREASMGVFGLILPDVRGSLYPSLIKGFGEVAGTSRHSIAICETCNELGRQGDAILQMIDRRVAGIAMVPTTDGVPIHQLRQLEEHGIPTVLCHRGVEDVAATVITWPWEEVARVAAREIVKRGHRHAAFVAYKRYRYTEMYETTFRQSLAEHGLALPVDRVVYHEDFIRPSGDDQARRALTAMLQSPNPPTAIFANDIDVGERVYLETMHLGMRVPEDLSIVAFGGKWREGSIREQLASVAIDEVELGRRAAKVLGRLQANRSSWSQEQKMVMPLEFIEGRSLAQLGVSISHVH